MEINNFREAFERGEDPLADVSDASDINSVCGVLKLYLRELREPIFSVQYFDQFMDLARKFFLLYLIFFYKFNDLSLNCTGWPEAYMTESNLPDN